MRHDSLRSAFLIIAGAVFCYLGLGQLALWALPVGLVCWVCAQVRSYRVQLIAGLLLWGALLFWVRHVSWLGWVGLSLMVAALWAIPFYLLARGVRVQLVGAIFILLEYLRGLIGFGWLPLAAGATYLSGAIAIGGQGMAGFLLLMLSIAAGQAILYAERRQRSIIWLTGVMLATGVSQLWYNYHAPSQATGAPIAIGFVQPDAPMRLEADDKASLADLRTLASLTSSLVPQKPSLILWPEQVTPWPVNTDPAMRACVEQGAAFSGVPILSGVLWRDAQGYYNSAAVIDPARGVIEAPYHKRRLVPFGEYIPFPWLRSLTPIVDSFVPGPASVKPLEAAGLRLWPLICYEDTFPELSWGATQADAIVVFTNNAWFGREGAQEQHAAHSRLRAIEQGRPVLRVANNGMSGIISPRGDSFFLSEKGDPYGRQVALLYYSSLKIDTPYSRAAWVLPIAALIILVAGAFKYRPRRSSLER
jgi:apolipoprotein N-acyltransferase